RRVPGRTRDSWGNGAVLADKTRSLAGRAGRGLAYLSANEGSFTPPSFHRENYQFFGQLPWPPHEAVSANDPYDKGTILAYVQHCRQKTTDVILSETKESLEGPCGFWWYKIPRCEFHLNNVRHVQHHASQISLYLRKSAGVEVGWAGSGFKDESEIP
ncbi:MAG: hypothetical protein ACLP9L_29335, partial [Thermoguttaceae bacterium]